MPRWVVGLIAIDIGLTLLYLVDAALGRPFTSFSHFIDLDSEANLPTWYASIQWFCAAGASWVFAIRNVERRPSRSWLLFLLPAVFLAFSLDEIARFHEYVGYLSDVLLPNGAREASVVSKTGLFFVLFGVPFAVLFAGLVIGDPAIPWHGSLGRRNRPSGAWPDAGRRDRDRGAVKSARLRIDCRDAPDRC